MDKDNKNGGTVTAEAMEKMQRAYGAVYGDCLSSEEDEEFNSRTEPRELSEQELRDFISRQDWIFAKTYADRAPHEYVVRHKINGTDKEFMQIVNYIRGKGITMYFWNRPNKYIFVDGHQYWAMGDEEDKVIVLNRCDLERYKISITWTGK